MKKKIFKPDLVPVGIPGIDKMLRGGIPKGWVVSLCGGPGSGKTIFCSQFIEYGARKANETGVYITFEEPIEQTIVTMMNVGIDMAGLIEEKKLAVIDASPMPSVGLTKGLDIIKLAPITGKGFSINDLSTMLDQLIIDIAPSRAVIDSISLLKLAHDEVAYRNMAIELYGKLIKSKITTLVVAETEDTLSDIYSSEQYFSHGSIVLHNFREGGEKIRAIEILKMRGQEHDRNMRPFEITNKGIMIAADENIY